MTEAYLNRISCAVPPHDVHDCFVRYARTRLADNRRRALFERMVERSAIDHRWSTLAPAAEAGATGVDEGGFYRYGRFPATGARMRRFAVEAPVLAQRAVAGLELGADAARVTHMLTVTCTGFAAPGLDLALIDAFGLSPGVERTTVGFMGCQGSINALRLARHIVRSEPAARVLLVSVELCTLHLQEVDDLDQILSFLLFGDGCGAALVSADPVGLALDGFHAGLAPAAREMITWSIGDSGFDMFLSGRLPRAVREGLRESAGGGLPAGGTAAIEEWAVHPGGRSILDAVQTAFGLAPDALDRSREVLAGFGNMSSATILFVLQRVMAAAAPRARGCALAFGPGLSTESMLFHMTG